MSATVSTTCRDGEVTHGGRLPEFVVLGAAKAGTTSLHQYLGRHTYIYMADPKEPQFFSRDEVFARGEQWYRSLFAGARPNQVCGEGSTTYTRWPHTADAATRLCAMLPDVRLIYLMRHPVDRAYSHYAHHMRLGVTKSFERALAQDEIYVDCSLYMKQLERYLRFLPRELILPLLTQDLQERRRETLEQVQRFLDVPVEPIAEPPINANVSGSDHFIRRYTTGLVRRLPGSSAVVGRVAPQTRQRAFQWIKRSPVGRLLARGHRLPPMTPQVRAMLLARFREPNRELEAFLGRSLAHWSR